MLTNKLVLHIGSGWINVMCLEVAAFSCNKTKKSDKISSFELL